MVEIQVKVQPSSSKRQITCSESGEIKIYLHSAPEKDKANKELIKLLSETLGVSKSDILIIKGRTNKLKRLNINGVDLKEIKQILHSSS